MEGMLSLGLWLLFVPMFVYVSRISRFPVTLTVVVIAGLLSILSKNGVPQFWGMFLALVGPILFFRLGSLFKIEDIRKPLTLLSVVYSFLIGLFVFAITLLITGNPFISKRFAVLSLAPGPVIVFILNRELNLHGEITRFFNTFSIVQTLIFSLFIVLVIASPSNSFLLVERFFTFGFVSIVVAVVVGLFLVYLETKIVSRDYLMVLTIGILLFLAGLFLRFDMPPYFAFLIMGLVVKNASISKCQIHKILESIDAPLAIAFIAGTFQFGNTISFDQSITLLLLYFIGRNITRIILGILIFKRFTSFSVKSLISLFVLQGGTSLYLFRNMLPSEVFPGMAIFVTSILGIIFVSKSLHQESTAFHPFIETPILEARVAGILRHLLEVLGIKRPTLKAIVVSEVMNKNFVSVEPSADILQVVDYMARSHTLSLPVVDRNGVFMGIVKATDLEHIAVNETIRHLVKAIDLAIPTYQIPPEEPIKNAIQIMEEHDIDCIPVVQDDRILGLLLRRDIVLSYA